MRSLLFRVDKAARWINALSLASTKGIVLCCAALALAAGGCAPSESPIPLNSTEGFQTTVLDARQPAVIFFYKEGCAACAALAPTMSQLAAEYHGRAVFAQYPLMSLVFIPNNAELQQRYDVDLYPTVILFVNGLERKRWVADYSAANYRQELDTVVAPAVTKPSN